MTEKRHVKTVRELEEEKRKRAHESAQGDDVCMLLERERERLKVEVGNISFSLALSSKQFHK